VPQVVTLALQALAATEAIREVLVIHTSPSYPRIGEAVARLDTAFAADERLAPWRDCYRRIAIAGRDGPVPDLLSPDDFAATLAALYGAVRDAKQAGFRVHLNVSGGRKLMALCGTTAAQLLFDEGDRLWYLQSSRALVAGRDLFAADPADVTMIPIPLMRWSPAPPILTGIALAGDPVAALTWQQERLAAARRRFLEHDLTPAEREVAVLAVRTGDTASEIAARLHKSPRTVAHQLEVIYQKLRLFLEVRDDVRVDRHTLIAEFAGMMPPDDGYPRPRLERGGS